MKRKKTSATKKIIIALTVLSVSLTFILFSIKQNNDVRTKAQATTINPATVEFPSKLFAPYVYTWDSYNFSNAYAANGQKFYTLAFIINGGGSCSPTWGGTPINSNFFNDQINLIRSNGGDVIVSFGGASGTEIGQSCPTAQALQAAYQQVITNYKLRWIDLDIEGGSLGDSASIDRRNKALAALQAANPGLKVSYTLPVTPTGLTQAGLNLLNNAKSNGVNITVVNIMTMDYGNGGGKMGQYAIDAINGTRTQVKNLGINTSYGSTSMIGQNDVASEVFTLANAQAVVDEIKNSQDVILLSMWASQRDNGGCPNQKSASGQCSGIAQANYAFTKIFQSFTNPSEAITPPAQTVVPSFVCIGSSPCTTPQLSPTSPTVTIDNPTLSKPPNLITIPSTTTNPDNPIDNPKTFLTKIIELIQSIIDLIRQLLK